jgi:hypothetical protein
MGGGGLRVDYSHPHIQRERDTVSHTHTYAYPHTTAHCAEYAASDPEGGGGDRYIYVRLDPTGSGPPFFILGPDKVVCIGPTCVQVLSSHVPPPFICHQFHAYPKGKGSIYYFPFFLLP